MLPRLVGARDVDAELELAGDLGPARRGGAARWSLWRRQGCRRALPSDLAVWRCRRPQAARSDRTGGTSAPLGLARAAVVAKLAREALAGRGGARVADLAAAVMRGRWSRSRPAARLARGVFWGVGVERISRKSLYRHEILAE